jgi:phage tail sheath protein FI
VAEFLSPGIFIEEVNSSGQIVEAVGTSTMALVGWTRRGPVDEARLITGNADFQRRFGEYTNDSRVPISVQAFFANGGSRAYCVRVVPTDSAAGESCITEWVAGEVIGVGTGANLALTPTAANLPLFKGSVTVSWRNDPGVITSGENPAFAPAEAEDLVGPSLGQLTAFPLTDNVVTVNWMEAFQASDTFFFNVLPIAGETITLDGRTYTFAADGSGAADTVTIGGSISSSIDNLVAAINLSGTDALEYGAGTTVHATSGALNLATAAAPYTPAAGTMLAYSLVGGVAGNGAVVSEVITDAASVWSTGAPGAYAGGVAAAAKVATITDANTVGGTDVLRVSAASIDRATGALSVTFNDREVGVTNGPVANSITVDYEAGGALQSVTDDGAGGWLPAATAGGTTVAPAGATGVDYATGELDISWTGGTDLPYVGNSVTVSYNYCQWELDADNVGVWSDRMTFRITGNENYYTSGDQSVVGAGEYSKFDLTVLVTSTVTGENEIKETFEEVVFDDPADPLYFPDLMNANSDFITVTDTGAQDIPSTMKGTDVSGEVLGTGDAVPTLVFTGTLASASIVKTSLVITYEHDGYTTGALRTLIADVNGNVTGTGLDITKTNTVNNTTGVYELNFLGGADAPADTKSITAAYISAPALTSIDYVFLGGSDGTLSGTTFDRTQFSSPILQPGRRGMFALDRIDEVMQLIMPDFAGDTTVMGDQIDYAEDRLDIFNIFTTPQNFDAEETKDFKTITFNRKTKYGAMYWPWIRVTDPTNAAKILTVPPLGWVAGVYARTDQTRNVGKAPGGTIDGALRFLTGLESDPDKGERDTIYPVRVNPLINTVQTGLAVWGVRTMSPTNDVLRYVNAVRLFQFVEKSIFNSTFGFVFESITSNLYSEIKTTIDGFLLNLFNTGHFAGATPDQAFFVVVDGSNNPPEVVNRGQVIVDIGIAPNRPGEFIRFRFSQKTLTA